MNPPDPSVGQQNPVLQVVIRPLTDCTFDRSLPLASILSIHSLEPFFPTRHSFSPIKSEDIRELQNIIERAVIVTQGSVLKVGLGDLTTTPKALENERSDDGNSMRKVLAKTEREQIVRALEQANWVISGAAARLGMKRSTLQARMQKLGIQITRTGASSSTTS